jgi:hypothetical protein
MIATLFGGVGGLALGATGGAGAIMTLPLLIYGLHIPVHQAILFSLFIVGCSAFLSLMPSGRWRNLDKRMVFLLSAGALIMVPIASYLSQHLSNHLLLIIFSLLMLVVGGVLCFSQKTLSKLKEQVGAFRREKNNTLLSRWYLLVFFGGIAGFLTGFLGLGGGLLIVPFLVFIFMLPLNQATSTSLVVLLITSCVAIMAHLKHETVNWYLLVSYLIGSMVGVFLGAFIAKKIPQPIIHRTMGLIIIVLAVLMLYQLNHASFRL